MTDNAHQESIRLEAGQTAPDFTLPGDTGDTVTLSALRGKNIVLYFYPAIFVTILHVCQLEDSPCSACRRIRSTSLRDSANATI